MRKIVLMQNVRIFKSWGEQSLLLLKTGLYIDSGTEIEVGEIEIRCFDHRDQQVVPVNFRGETHYILESELNPTPSYLQTNVANVTIH